MTDKIKSKNHLSYLFSKNWQYAQDNHKNIVIFWIMFAIANLWDVVVSPIMWSSIINIIQLKGITNESFKTLCFWLLALLFSSLFFWAFHGPARVLEICNAFKVRRNYRYKLLAGVMNLPLDWHTEHHSGDTIDKVEKGTSSLFRFSEDSFQIIYSMVQLVGSVVVLAYFSPLSFFIVLFFLLVSVWITIRFDKILISQYDILNKKENEISRSVFDSISNITTVVVLRVEKLIFNSIMHKVDEPYELFKKNTKYSELKWFLTSVCCRLMQISVLLLYFYQHLGSKPGVLVGEVYLLFQYLIKISDIFFSFTSLYGEVLKQRSRVSNAETLANDFMAVGFSNHILPKDWKEIEIRNLTFSYPETGKNHLDDVSMTVKRGQRIAFVGETGSGKTTMLKLMRDLYHPRSLGLFVDGKEVVAGFDGIARAISLIPQNPEIFATTVLENITLRAEYSKSDIDRAVSMACFGDVMAGLRNGFNSSTKEKGVSFSGGQNQRLALARGLLASFGKDIILLDEPTSSLDPETEIRVYQNIMSGFPDATIISTIHKFNLLGIFDVIYVFDGGKIIGVGTQQQLSETCPKFSYLWNKYMESLSL